MGKKTRHHLRPKSRGGIGTPDNLLFLYWDKHQAWHKLFGNRTLDEIIEILQRVRRQKQRQANGY